MKTVIVQEQMIDRVRHLCHQDGRIAAALMYGSFSQNEGDEYSDIEFYIFVNDTEFDNFVPADWVQQISPLLLYFVNDFGVGIAIFENMVRGEFIFEKISEILHIPSLKRILSFPQTDRMLLLDRTGDLRELAHQSATGFQRSSDENVASTYNNFLNFLLSGLCLLARGERARALDMLSMVHRYLLLLIRIHEGKILQSDTRPFRNLEKDISPSSYNVFIECTGSLQGDGLERAYKASWSWSKQIIDELGGRHNITPPLKLIQSIDSRVEELAD